MAFYSSLWPQPYRHKSSMKLVDYLAANRTVRYGSVRFGRESLAMQGGNQEHDTPAYRLQPQLSVQLESQTTGTQSLDHMEYQTYPAAPTQPPLYPPMVSHSQPATIVIHTTTLNRIPVGRDPTFIRCPSCQSDVVTVIHSTTSKRTHAAALILCFVG